MKYAATKRNVNLPAWVGDVPPDVWAQTWTDRPREVVRLGLRTLSETALSEVSSLAEARARKYHPHSSPTDEVWVDEYNRALVIHAVGRALCTAESADVPYWDLPDFIAPGALDPVGSAWLFALLTVETVKASVINPPEPPTELLGALNQLSPHLDALPPAKRFTITRLLQAALDAVGD